MEEKDILIKRLSEKVLGEGMSVNATRIDLRLSHPNLYRSIMVFALTYVGLGLNFILTNPTFNPYEIPKEVTGSIFLFLGLAKIIFLNLCHNLKIVRILMALQIAFIIFWGVGTSITFFQGKTSLQLFVLYAGLGFLEYFLLVEPYLNPLTSKLDENPHDRKHVTTPLTGTKTDE